MLSLIQAHSKLRRSEVNKIVLKQKTFKKLLALNAILHMSDVASTYIFRKIPGSTMKEGNPLLRYIVNNNKWGLLIFIKLAYWAIFTNKLQKYYLKYPEQATQEVSIANLAMGLVVLWNLYHITRYLKKINSK